MKPTIFWGNVFFYLLGGGFKYFSCSPLFGEDEPILTNIFQRGWFNHQLVIFFNHQFSMAPPPPRNSRTLLIRVQTKNRWFQRCFWSRPVITIGIPSPMMWAKKVTAPKTLRSLKMEYSLGISSCHT